MQHRFLILVTLVSASALAALASACGGSDATDVDGGQDATTSDASNDAQQTNDTGGGDVTNDVTSPADAATDGGCSGKGAQCLACCANASPNAAAFFTDTEETCACKTPGDCKTECASTLCVGKPAAPQSSCEMCARDQDAGGCRAAALAACLNDANCHAFAVCAQSCAGAGPKDAAAD